MFKEAKVDILNLLGCKYDRSIIKLGIDNKGIVLKVHDKTERFAFRKIKYSQIAGTGVLFQSDGLKLMFSSVSQNIENILLDSISDTYSSSEITPTQILHDHKREFNVYSNTPYSHKRNYVTNNRISSVPLVKIKATKAAVRKVSRSPIQASMPIPDDTLSKLASLGSPTSISISFSNIKPAQSDAVDEIDWSDPPACSIQPQSVRTNTEYAYTQPILNSSVASIRKYGTKNTSSCAQVSRTLFPVSTSKTSSSHSSQDNQHIAHVTTPAKTPKRTLFDTFEAVTSMPPRESPKWLTALQQEPTSNRNRPNTPPRYKQSDSMTPTISTVSKFQSAAKTVAQVSGRSTGLLSKTFEKATTDAASSSDTNLGSSVKISTMGSSTFQRKRLLGGIRNLGNSCYIAATLQALFAMEIFCSHLYCEFWLSLLALETPSSGKEVNVVSSGSVNSTPSVLTTPLTAGKSEVISSGGICYDSGTVNTGHASSTVINQTQESGSLNKYKQHSVVRELTVLIRSKREMGLQQPGGGGGIGVLDVTRLKRTVSHHTNKYVGYSQQDAHEFLSDLLRLIQEETSERWAGFYSAWQSRHLMVPTEEGSLTAETCTKTQIDSKRARGVAKNHCKLLLSSASNSDSWLKDSGDSVLRLNTTIASSSSTPVAADNTHCNLEACLPIAVTMEGIVRVQMQCLQCGFQSVPKLEPYEHFSLDICDDHPLQQLSIDSLLENFFAEEVREVCCNQCSNQKIQSQASVETGRALAAVRLLRAPRVMILHLKRFRYDPIRQCMVKIHSAVTFPLRLSLKEYMYDTKGSDLTRIAEASPEPARNDMLPDQFWSSSVESLLLNPSDPFDLLRSISGEQQTQEENQQPGQYALVAVVRHIGTSEAAGHYVCDTFINSTKKWQRCDDSSVYAVDEETVLQEKGDPYLLFYTAVV